MPRKRGFSECMGAMLANPCPSLYTKGLLPLCDWADLIQTEADIAEMEKNIASLKQALAEKTAPQMVVNTRLENR